VVKYLQFQARPIPLQSAVVAHILLFLLALEVKAQIQHLVVDHSVILLSEAVVAVAQTVVHRMLLI
jgi:hypothetical protein